VIFFAHMAGAVYSACQDLPTNRFVRTLRRRPSRRGASTAALLATAYLVAGALCAYGVGSGGPGWLHLGVLVCWWNALKLSGHGLLAIIRSVRARTAGGQVSPVLGDGVDAGAERGRGVSLPAEVSGGRRR
jgi:hypothetical protein